MPTIFREYTVEGSNSFPFDMLRYDRCWPKRESQDVPKLAHSRHTRQVTLVGLNSPTIGRWKSFGWEIVAIEKVWKEAS